MSAVNAVEGFNNQVVPGQSTGMRALHHTGKSAKGDPEAN